jgi:hypothetical protein
MPLGTQENAVVDRLLTGVSQAIVSQGLIADQILTPLAVDQTTGKIGKYGNGHLRIQANTKIVGKGRYPMIELVNRLTDTYDIEEHGLSDVVSKKDYLNVVDPFNAESDVVTALTEAMLIGREKAIADTLTNASTITQNTTLSGNAQFNNISHADSKPLEVTRTAHGTIRDAIGMKANTLIVPGKVYDNLTVHQGVLDKLGYKENRAGQLTSAEIARAFEVDRVLVAEGIYLSSKEGQADVIAPIWGKDMLFAYINPTAGKYMKTLGFHCRLRSMSGLQVFKNALLNPPGSTEILVSNWFDDLITDAKCAYLIKDAIA